MKLSLAIKALALLVTIAAAPASVPSYEAPGRVGLLFANEHNDLVIGYTVRGRVHHFWNVSTGQDLAFGPGLYDYIGFLRNNHFVPLKPTPRLTLRNGAVVSWGALDSVMMNCQWPYRLYVKFRMRSGVEKKFAFLVKIPPHRQDLVYDCPGVRGASFLSVSYKGSFPELYARPEGGFWITIQGLPYVIGFSDDGETDFFRQPRDVVMIPEDIVAKAYDAMAEGRLSPQAALDSLLPW